MGGIAPPRSGSRRALLPGFGLDQTGAAFVGRRADRVLNALLPPLLAALRLPFTLVAGFLLVLVADALLLQVAGDVLPDDVRVDSFGDALLAALVISAVSVVLQVVARHQRRRRVHAARDAAHRPPPGRRAPAPTCRGSSSWRSTGSRCRCCATRCATAARRRWRAGSPSDGYRLLEWETDLSSQTGASQAGILLGSNDDIPAFRWVEKETGRMMVCSSPADCAEIERRHATGIGLLADGGASRGNLLSGEAEEAILTVSRIEAEKRANPGYRAFFANGFNVTRALVLFGWEVIARVDGGRARQRGATCARAATAAASIRCCAAAMCVIVRDLIVFGVLTDMMRGRPAVYATFASYDEVAHHSGLERADTLEALRKLDQQFGRIERARRYAPRPYELVVLSDHGQTQGATFKQRNGYGLDELVRALARRAARSPASRAATSSSAMVAPRGQRGDRPQRRRSGRRTTSRDREVVVLGSGNLGLVYLMEEPRRLTLEEIDERHPELIPALREHPHVGWLLVRSAEHGAVVLGADGAQLPRRRPRRGRGPARAVLAHRGAPPAAHRRLPARRRHHGRQLLRPGARRGLRVRGADLLPRRPRRPADAPVHPLLAERCRCRPSRSSAPPRCTALLGLAERCCRRSRPPGRSALQDGRLLAPELPVVEDAAVVSA